MRGAQAPLSPNSSYRHTFLIQDTHLTLANTHRKPKNITTILLLLFCGCGISLAGLFFLLLLRFHFYLSGISRGTTGTLRSPVYERIRQLLLLREEEKIFSSFLLPGCVCVCHAKRERLVGLVAWLGWVGGEGPRREGSSVKAKAWKGRGKRRDNIEFPTIILREKYCHVYAINPFEKRF